MGGTAQDWPGLEGGAWVRRFGSVLARLRPDLDAESLLLGRATLEGRFHRGSVATGGACRMLATRDAHVAVNLPRESDWDLVPAWLDLAEITEVGDWDVVAEALASHRQDVALSRADLCGLPVAALRKPGTQDPQLSARGQGLVPSPWLSTRGGPREQSQVLNVVDLSAMWAGPLCGALLAEAGAQVTKLESPTRPDPTATASPELDRRLNGSKRRMRLPLGTPQGTRQLRVLLRRADVVIESARPRVMAQWGIDPMEYVAAGCVWVSITAYGRTGPWSNRPGFGDDTAVAGGLWRPGPPGPEFVGDATADPVTGVLAALAVTESVESGSGALLDVAMREAVAHVVGDDAGFDDGGFEDVGPGG